MYNRLMIVAHPDDETIFGGATLIKDKGWKVICVTNGYNPVRVREFKKAMKAVRAEYEIWSFPDRRHGTFNTELLKRKIKQALQEREYIKVVTHNLAGEYGHPQHKALSEIVYSLVESNLFTFSISSEAVDLDLLRQKLNILWLYTSQRAFIKKLTGYILFEGMEQVK